MAFEDEQDSFQAFAEALPNNTIFLVDTYDTIQGVKKAIEVGKWLRERGKKLIGIRLDSGDLSYLSIKSRELLDAAGFKDTLICASNELDENVISELKKQGSQITLWGVGTHLVTGKDQPALDGVYKLSAIRNPGEPWKYKLKLSEQMLKVSNPGILQVKRFYNPKENLADMVFDIHTDTHGDYSIVDPLDPTRQKFLKKGIPSRDLLIPIFREGKRVYELPSLDVIRANTKKELSHFNDGIKRFLNPHQYSVGMEQSLYDLKVDLIKKIRSKGSHAHILSEESYL
jgi:nicotinate phosphoribosyltransferase